jgi:hypothetical protein
MEKYKLFSDIRKKPYDNTYIIKDGFYYNIHYILDMIILGPQIFNPPDPFCPKVFGWTLGCVSEHMQEERADHPRYGHYAWFYQRSEPEYYRLVEYMGDKKYGFDSLYMELDDDISYRMIFAYLRFLDEVFNIELDLYKTEDDDVDWLIDQFKDLKNTFPDLKYKHLPGSIWVDRWWCSENEFIRYEKRFA